MIEDWNWAHYKDRFYDTHWADQPALSNLCLEIALAVGSIQTFDFICPIGSINIMPWGVVIRKDAEVAPDFRLDDLIQMGERRKYVRF